MDVLRLVGLVRRTDETPRPTPRRAVEHGALANHGGSGAGRPEKIRRAPRSTSSVPVSVRALRASAHPDLVEEGKRARLAFENVADEPAKRAFGLPLHRGRETQPRHRPDVAAAG